MPKVLLGDVAIERRETYKGNKAGFPIVGLEHLIPGEITLTTWSEDSKNTFSKMFHKGDVLFGRRRAYLKKAAVAPFDGICSGDITVIQADADKIIPELLPFIIQNDTLFDFAVGKSAGSLSPRVKWEHLKNYEFKLPDMDKQRELAKLLWAMDATKKSYQDLITATDELVKSQFIEEFGNPILCEQDTSLPALGEMCVMKAGKFVKADDIKEECDSGYYPCYGGNGIRGYVPTFNQDGDHPLIGRQGALCGNVQYASGQFYATEHAVVVTPKINNLDRLWLYHLLLRLNLERYASGAAQPGIAVNKLEQIRFNLPQLGEQQRFAAFTRQSDKSKFELEQALSELTATYKSIISENLG